jgi:hypothetical protein
MAKRDEDVAFIEAKDLVYENLDAIRVSLVLCVDEGMMDLEDSLYNLLLGLLDDAAILRSWDELDALVVKAKVLEQDIAAWLAMHGRTSYSLAWPKKPQ